MGSRRNNSAEVLPWTFTLVSPTSTEVSEDPWEDEDEEQGQAENEFDRQMDENGIIGLPLETCGDTHPECKLPGSSLHFTPEGEDPSGCLGDLQLEDLKYDLSEHLYGTEPDGEAQELSSWDSRSSRQEVVCYRTKQMPGVPRDKCMMKKQKDEEGKESDGNSKNHQFARRLENIGATSTLADGYISNRDDEEKSSKSSCSGHLPGVESSGVSKHHCPESQKTDSVVMASSWPQLFHFTAEELASAQGIDAETFPEMSCSERLPESNCNSYSSWNSSSRCAGIRLRASPQPAASFSEEFFINHYSGSGSSLTEESRKSDKHHNGTPSQREARKHSLESISSRTCPLSTVETDTLTSKQQSKVCDKEPRTLKAGSDGPKVDGSRKGYLRFHTPDFSRVEPKVCFPKGGYKPPKSKQSLKSLSPELPLVYKSPADIVKEVLLNNTDGSSAASDCNRKANNATNFTVPLEFRCRQQATTLLEQLQEDYNRLLTKYAEAENTIDRLRLEAKVDLYSDPAKPDQSPHSGLKHETKKFLTLDFSQTQRAEITPAFLSPNGLNTQKESSDACVSTRSPDLQSAQELSNIIVDQTGKFLQQLQAFEELLKSDKLKSFEKIKGLAQLTEALNSLERGYLLARDEHKLLQQGQAETSHFDPQRELEGLIFECGLRIEELKEQTEQLEHEQPASEASSSLTLQPTPSSDSCDGGAMFIHPQSPAVPSLVDPGEKGKVAKRSNKQEVQDEETLDCLYHRFQTTSKVPDTVEPADHIKELSKTFPHPATLKSDMHHQDKEEEQQAQGIRKHMIWKTTSPRTAKLDHQGTSFGTGNHERTRSSPPLRSHSTMLPVLLPRNKRRSESSSSSLSSLVPITASQQRSSKDEKGSRRVLSQKGILSPETDSGFVGSEASQLTSAAAPTILHQRASEGVSVQENFRRPETGPAALPPPSRLPCRLMVQERRVDPQPSHRPPRRMRRTLSCSPQHHTNRTEPNRVDSRSSEFVPENNSTHTGSEVEHSDCYIKSINSLHSSHSSFSPAVLHHHSDSLRARRSSLSTNYNDAMQALQSEVLKLKERLESFRSSEILRIQSVRQKSEVHQGRRETQTVDGVKDDFALRGRAKERTASPQRQKPPHDILATSDAEFSAAKPQPMVSRRTQTSAASDSFYSVNVLSKATQTSPVGGNRKPTRSFSCCHCYPAAVCHKQDASTQFNSQPVTCPDAAARRHFPDSTPPVLLQCMPVCTPQLLLHSQPVHKPPDKIKDASSGLRGSDERRRKSRRSPWIEKHHGLDVSLNRAIKAAQHMRHTSRHMARSLATGLQYQERLTQSCNS